MIMKLFPISPKIFLDFAKNLNNQKIKSLYGEPIINRTIIDRLYYASFLCVRSWIEENITNHGLRYNSDDHGIILDEIYNCDFFNYSEKYKINSFLNNLRDYRNDSSYVLSEDKLRSPIIDKKEIIFISDDVDILFESFNI